MRPAKCPAELCMYSCIHEPQRAVSQRVYLSRGFLSDVPLLKQQSGKVRRLLALRTQIGTGCETGSTLKRQFFKKNIYV